jgi:pyruvate formate lyase activating enzyme
MMSPQHQDERGVVFNVQKYSLHDGPGIRTVVFLKGCPAACRWCSNPESQDPMPELAHNPGECISLSACGRCRGACPQSAIGCGVDDKAVIGRDLCGDCSFPCAAVCPTQSLVAHGQERSVDDLLAFVEQDSVFYDSSGGGLTLSGGEPLLQPQFALALLREAKARGIHRALETCGHCSWPVLARACESLDFMIYDLKSVDASKHREQTGIANERILSNFHRMCCDFPELPLLVRTPVIPGFNDREEDVEAILSVISAYPHVRYELLPYHRTAQAKYASLGREYPLADITLAPDRMTRLRALVASRRAAGEGSQFVLEPVAPSKVSR